MGRGSVAKPKRLSAKLKQLRVKLNFSHKEMFEALVAHKVKIHLGYISLYEIGDRSPNLLVLLAYSKIARVPMNLLVDDELELPENLPSSFSIGFHT